MAEPRNVRSYLKKFYDQTKELETFTLQQIDTSLQLVIDHRKNLLRLLPKDLTQQDDLPFAEESNLSIIRYILTQRLNSQNAALLAELDSAFCKIISELAPEPIVHPSTSTPLQLDFQF